MSFTRRVEDFVCERCGEKVQGNGYTDHCPACLWGKHVDVEPGDRKAQCGGLMEPIALSGSSPKYRITYRCSKCEHEFIVDAAEADHVDALLALASRHGIIGA